jgi:hypothetical protein
MNASPTVGADEHKAMVVGKCCLACCMDCANRVWCACQMKYVFYA